MGKMEFIKSEKEKSELTKSKNGKFVTDIFPFPTPDNLY